MIMASDHRLLGAALNVADLQRATDFYTHVFGLKEVTRYEMPGMTEVFLKWAEDDKETAIILVVHGDGETPSADRQGYGRFVVRVPDCAAAAARVREAGGEATDLMPISMPDTGIDMVVCGAK